MIKDSGVAQRLNREPRVVGIVFDKQNFNWLALHSETLDTRKYPTPKTVDPSRMKQKRYI